MEALNQLELEEINEDDEEVDEEDEIQHRRRTILDKVVGNVFGKNKQNLYEMFPSLAVITVPKMPIITPKGDEIILRKKYNNNMTLLNEAFEQKKELYNNEIEDNAEEKRFGAETRHLRDQSQELDTSPKVGSQRKNSNSEASPSAGLKLRSIAPQVPRKISDDSDSIAIQKKPTLLLNKISHDPVSMKKSLVISVNIEDVGDGEGKTMTRAKSYMTDKMQKDSNDGSEHQTDHLKP